MIEFFNPNDKPFGALSNQMIVPIEINGKVYQTPDHYVYSELLHNPYHKDQVITTITADEARTAYNFLLDQEILYVIRNSLIQAYSKLAEKSASFKEALLQTGNRFLVYHDLDTMLGDSGLNLVGLVLMDVRNNLNLGPKDRVYNIFLAYEGMKNAFFNGENISNVTPPKYKSFIGYKNPDECDVVYDEYLRGAHDYVNEEMVTPGVLPNIVIRENRNKAETYAISIKQEAIFSMFLGYVAEKSQSRVPNKLHHVENRSELVERVYALYLNDRLPHSLAKKINNAGFGGKERLLDQYDFNDEKGYAEEEDVSDYDPYVFDFNDPLSPRIKYPGIMIVISKKDFPTVLHFVYYNLIRYASDSVDAYDQLFAGNEFARIDYIEQIYRNIFTIYQTEKIKALCDIILPIKFSLPVFRMVLSLTRSEKLEYTSTDPYLGSDRHRGEQIVGKTLEKLRRDMYLPPTEHDIMRLMNHPVIINRINDIMNTINIFSLNGTQRVDINAVIELFYMPCKWYFNDMGMSFEIEQIFRTYAQQHYLKLDEDEIQKIYSYIYGIIDMIGFQSEYKVVKKAFGEKTEKIEYKKNYEQRIRDSIKMMSSPCTPAQLSQAISVVVGKLDEYGIRDRDDITDIAVRLLEGQGVGGVGYDAGGVSGEPWVLDVVSRLKVVNWSRIRFFGDVYGGEVVTGTMKTIPFQKKMIIRPQRYKARILYAPESPIDPGVHPEGGGGFHPIFEIDPEYKFNIDSPTYGGGGDSPVYKLPEEPSVYVSPKDMSPIYAPGSPTYTSGSPTYALPEEYDIEQDYSRGYDYGDDDYEEGPRYGEE